jgi:drug/metabolite transporter (DMT)-like permease
MADFLGGVQSRRHAALAVLVVSQLAAFGPVVIITAATGHAAPGAGAIAWAALAGAVGTVGIAAFYRGLAVGTMSIVAPIASTGAAVPVVVGLIGGERPSALQAVGLAVAIVGVMLAGREPEGSEAMRPEAARTALVLALVAAVGIGVTFVALDRATKGAGVAWTVLVQRTVEVTLLGAAALVVRPARPRGRQALIAIAAVGLLDVSAQALFAIATTQGLLSIVSVLSSLYPAVTVLLARTVLHERVSRMQEAGVVAILAGVVAISAG